jgi:uncharacterized membrane protein
LVKVLLGVPLWAVLLGVLCGNGQGYETTGMLSFFCLWTGVHTRLKDRRKHTSLSTKVRLQKNTYGQGLKIVFILLNTIILMQNINHDEKNEMQQLTIDDDDNSATK